MKRKKYKAKQKHRQSARFNSYSEDIYNLDKVNRMRREIGLSELVIQERNCLKCNKNFSGIKGIEFCCERCRKIETSEFEI